MRILGLLVLALFAMNAAAQLYSWKDADGKVHYSDQPPAGKTPARKLAPPPAPSADPAAVRRDLAEKDMEWRKRQKEAQELSGKAEQDKADASERRSQCERAQGNLRAIESGQARYTTSSTGERVALDGAVREAELAAARKTVDSWCK